MPIFRKITKEIATWESARQFRSYTQLLPNPALVLRERGEDITICYTIDKNPKVSACRTQRDSKTLSLEWKLEQGESEPLIYRATYDWLSKMPIKKINEGGLWAWKLGYQPMELVWGSPSPWVFPERIEAKPAEWYGFDLLGNTRFFSYDGGWEGEIVPPDRTVIIGHRRSYRQPYGESVYLDCFWPVKFLNGGICWWLELLEKFGRPVVIVERTGGIGQSGKELGELEEKWKELIGQGIIIIKQGHEKATMVNGITSAQADIFKEFAADQKEAIAGVILSQSLSTGLPASGRGSYGAVEAAGEQSATVSMSDAQELEAFWNNGVLYWVGWRNWRGQPMPRLCLYERKLPNIVSLAPALEKSGWKITEQFLQREHGFIEGDLEKTEAPMESTKKSPLGNPDTEMDEEENPTQEDGNAYAASTKMQSIIFDKLKYTAEKAREWLKEHKFHSGKIDETEEFLRFRQQNPDDFEEGSFRTISLKPGIKGIIGRLKSLSYAAPSPYADQAALDRAIESISPERMQKMAEDLVNPILTMTDRVEGYEEALKALADLYPDLNTEQLEEMLTNWLAGSHNWGRGNAGS